MMMMMSIDLSLLSWCSGSVKKGKVDNLYRSSIIDPIAAEPLLQYPLVHWTHAIGCHIQVCWRESPCKVPNYTAWWTEAHWCEQLAQGRCPTMQRQGVEPVTSRSRVQRASHYTTKPPFILIITIIIILHAPCQRVALLAANSLHSDLSKAISIASSKVRLCRDRSFFRVAIQEV